MKHKILSITPIKHIDNLVDKLKSLGDLDIIEDPKEKSIFKIIHKYDVIYTNPNKSNIYIGPDLINKATKLKFICTASTGTNHIHKEYAKKKKIKIISLTTDMNTIRKISSTAELAFALTLCSLRNIIPSFNSVKRGEWDYTKFIGRQMNYLTIGVVGYGRLGIKYIKYCKSFGSKILVYDPYKNIKSNQIVKVNSFKKLLKNSDIISFHVHLNKETYHMINKKNITSLNKNIIIINTSRGDIIDEKVLINFLKKNKNAKFATDVLEDEINNKKNNKLINFSKNTNQIIITPHIGGMTSEAQKLAYHRVAEKLKYLLRNE